METETAIDGHDYCALKGVQGQEAGSAVVTQAHGWIRWGKRLDQRMVDMAVTN
jgi:hypothetical protein